MRWVNSGQTGPVRQKPDLVVCKHLMVCRSNKTWLKAGHQFDLVSIQHDWFPPREDTFNHKKPPGNLI